MRLDLQRDPDFTGAEDLDELPAAYGALRGQDVRVDLSTVREQAGQLVQVDHLVLGAERVLEALELGHPHVERHLAALERLGHLVARLGALGAAAGGLALGALAATDAGLRLVRARSRAQGMDLERHRLLDLLDRHEMLDGPDHPADLGPVLLDHDVTHALEAQRAQGLALAVRAADRRTALGDLEPWHLRLPHPRAPATWPRGRRPRSGARA